MLTRSTRVELAPARATEPAAERCASRPGSSEYVVETVVDRPCVVAVVDVDVEAREIDLHVVARRPRELAARRELVAAVRVVAPQENVVAEAVVLVAVNRRAVRRGSSLTGPPTAAPSARVPSLPVVASKSAASRVGRRLRAHVNEPAERVRAVARALRAAQHLDAIDVEQRADAAEPREVDVVDDETDRRIRRAVVLLELADAAQLKVARARAFAGQVQVRDAADRFLEMLLRRGSELVAIEHADADRAAPRCAPRESRP